MQLARIGIAVLLIAVSYAVGAQESRSESLRAALETEEMRPLQTPSLTLNLGALVVPGVESESAIMSLDVLHAVGNPRRTHASVDVEAPVEVEVSREQLGIWLSMPADAIAGGQCAQVKLSAKSIDIESLDLRNPTGQRREVIDALVRSEIASADELKSYVFITAVARPVWRVASAQCFLTPGATKLLGRLVWAYQAGLPARSVAASGNSFLLEVLRMFELDKLSQKNVVTVSKIEVEPDGCQIGWLDRPRTRNRPADKIADDEYQWLGVAPIGQRDFWPGRFYFRLKKGDRSVTRPIDFTVAASGQPVRLRLED